MLWQAPGKAPGKVARGSDGFGKLSGDEMFCEEAPRAELTVCSPQAITSGLSGNRLLQIRTKGSSPGVLKDMSLFPLPCPSFL